MTHILAIDQGTTSSRAIVFDGSLNVTASAQEEFAQHFPDSGWVEHEPEDLWRTTIVTCRAAMDKAGLSASGIAAKPANLDAFKAAFGAAAANCGSCHKAYRVKK